MTDEQYMSEAIGQALAAQELDEVPVGAVIVRNGEVIACAHNLRESSQNATAHAELLAITAACEVLHSWRLNECDLYVTLEPCAMCAGAIINARIRRVCFGAYDPKAGCCGTLYDLTGEGKFNHRPEVRGGVLESECAKLLSDYFKQKRVSKC